MKARDYLSFSLFSRHSRDTARNLRKIITWRSVEELADAAVAAENQNFSERYDPSWAIDLERASSLEHSIGFFQRFVKKKRDIRTTVVGRDVFSVSIESQRSESTKIDWRRYDIARTPHHEIETDPIIATRCLQFLDNFGLDFGAFDFAQDQDDNWWFLEMNPNGLWAWLELLTGAPISEAIAAYLISRSNAHQF